MSPLEGKTARRSEGSARLRVSRRRGRSHVGAFAFVVFHLCAALVAAETVCDVFQCHDLKTNCLQLSSATNYCAPNGPGATDCRLFCGLCECEDEVNGFDVQSANGTLRPSTCDSVAENPNQDFFCDSKVVVGTHECGRVKHLCPIQCGLCGEVEEEESEESEEL
mmetsp:Transcript_26903/g.61939  ORF Transcript_26903/g.61939 Transcript_26903/m.61939 type:complete len:165 (-) Transcript_26903:253-747(-)